MIKSASEIETLARTVEDNGDVFFVPAFAGLLAPHWRGDARGLLCGLTAYNTKAHVARAVLESTAFQVLIMDLSRKSVLIVVRFVSIRSFVRSLFFLLQVGLWLVFVVILLLLLVCLPYLSSGRVGWPSFFLYEVRSNLQKFIVAC